MTLPKFCHDSWRKRSPPVRQIIHKWHAHTQTHTHTHTHTHRGSELDGERARVCVCVCDRDGGSEGRTEGEKEGEKNVAAYAALCNILGDKKQQSVVVWNSVLIIQQCSNSKRIVDDANCQLSIVVRGAWLCWYWLLECLSVCVITYCE